MQKTTIPDKALMYASHFHGKDSNANRMRENAYQIPAEKIIHHQKNGTIPSESIVLLQGFQAASEVDQRAKFLEDKGKLRELFRVLFMILENIVGDADLTHFILALINGILEDKRSRVQGIIFNQKSIKKVDAVQILYNILQTNQVPQVDRDLAAHSLSMIIMAYEFANCFSTATSFMTYVTMGGDNLSTRMRTTCLLQLCKSNELAMQFVIDRSGISGMIVQWLKNECLKNDQIAYNVIALMWVLSYHEFALPHFSDFSLNVIELSSKVLDYFNKEKIVRIVLQLFDNLKDNKDCLDHLCMINALNLVIKLQNRPWVDKDIEKTLEKLEQFFDANYQEFSSFEKWKKQVNNDLYTWSTVHTEKFWQSAFVNFHNSENLECIKKEIQFLSDNASKNSMDMCVKKAVVCFDLGEFARYFPNGRQFLTMSDAKSKLTAIMQDPSVTPELKKEAITAYQKILMKSYGQ